MELLILIGVVSWIALACVVGTITDKRGQGFAVGFFLSLLFSPVIGLLVAIALPVTTTPESAAAVTPAGASTGTTRLAGDTSDTPSAMAWRDTRSSLNADDYGDFVEAFRGTPEALLAVKHRRLLDHWASLDKADVAALERFVAADVFSPLKQHVREVIAEGASQNPSVAELHQKILAQETEALRLEREAAARAEESLKAAQLRTEEEQQAAEARRLEEAVTDQKAVNWLIFVIVGIFLAVFAMAGAIVVLG